MCQPFYRGFRSFVQEANKIIDYLLIFFDGSGAHRDLHSFPTRRSSDLPGLGPRVVERASLACPEAKGQGNWAGAVEGLRSEEHTSELQSHHDLVCRLLLEKKKKAMSDNGSRSRRDLYIRPGI